MDKAIAGTWRCKLKDADGSELPFILELKLDGEQVNGTADQGVITKGIFKDRKLEIEVKEDQSTYTLTASLKQGKLTGQLKQHDTGESGTWEGERTDFAWRQASSPATLPLYEYRNRESGARFYSTRSDLENRTIKRAAEPICRVWRNPMSLLILDYTTRASSQSKK
jgi:hypothetical protein